MELHQECKKRLIEVLTEQLPKITVNNQMFLDRRSAILLVFAEEIIPKTGPIKKQLESFIGELPVYDFIFERLAKKLSESQEYNKDLPTQKLVEIEGYEDPEALATRLVSEIDSLPWTYTFTIELHKEVASILYPVFKDIGISEAFSIKKIDENFEAKYPLMSGIKSRDQSIGNKGLLSIFDDNKWKEESICIQIQREGFIGHYGETATFENIKEDFKSFCGLGIALRLFKIDKKYRSSPSKAQFYVHQFEADNWVIQRTQELEQETSETFYDLVLNDLDGTLDTNNKLSAWAQKTLNDIHYIFSNKDKTKKLLLACQWLFESFSGKNELLAFVQTTVVIEILLGDKADSDQIGLGNLLRNRCAYLISSTQYERENVLKDFQKIYDVRSKIVHGGKSRINAHERQLLRKLQWMCRRVIQEEVILLIKDFKNNA